MTRLVFGIILCRIGIDCLNDLFKPHATDAIIGALVITGVVFLIGIPLAIEGGLWVVRPSAAPSRKNR